MKITIRNMRDGEQLPAKLYNSLFEELDPEWVWLAETEDGVVGSMICARAHDLLLMLRLLTLENAPSNVALALIRGVCDDAINRGLMRAMLIATEGRDAERKLLRIARLAPVAVRQAPATIAVGSLIHFAHRHPIRASVFEAIQQAIGAI